MAPSSTILGGTENEAMGRFKLRKPQALLGGEMLDLGVVAACFDFFWGAAMGDETTAATPFWLAGVVLGG